MKERVTFALPNVKDVKCFDWEFVKEYRHFNMWKYKKNGIRACFPKHVLPTKKWEQSKKGGLVE